MVYVKLQIGCLIIILFVTALYIKGTSDNKVPCSRLFDILLVLCPWSVVFDGATAYTVNALDAVPGPVNLALHGAFFVLMDLVVIVAFLYVVQITVGLPRRRLGWALLLAPGAASIVGVLAFLGQLDYAIGRYTNYSYGASPLICYGSVVVHFGAALTLIMVKRHAIESRRFMGIAICLAVSFALLVTMVVYNEALVTALFPTVLIVGLYLSIEDPAARRLKQYGADMVMGYATLVESRDDSTGGHIMRTQRYVGIILDQMARDPRYRKTLTRDYVNCVMEAAPMHDIGKISTPDHILQKPGRLTPEEFAVMKEHAARGGEIIQKTFAGVQEPQLCQITHEVARHHHEKWDGSGYPDGLAGEAIPLHARIMAIADVFDAVSAKRCYRDALPLDACFEIIEKGAGRDFDPHLAGLFLNAREQVVAARLEEVPCG